MIISCYISPIDSELMRMGLTFTLLKHVSQCLLFAFPIIELHRREKWYWLLL